MNGNCHGKYSATFIVASHVNWGQLIKERICSSGSKFFPLRVDPTLERFSCPGRVIGSHKNCLPLKNYELLPIHFKCGIVHNEKKSVVSG